MATPVKAFNGEQMLVQVETTPGSGVFEHDCLINTERGIDFSSDVGTSVVPFCDEPTEPGWKEVTIDGLQATVSGSGIAHSASIEAWFNWFKSGDTKNCRVFINVPAANGGGYWAGAFNLSAFQVTGTRREKSTTSVTLISSGEVTWTDAPA